MTGSLSKARVHHDAWRIGDVAARRASAASADAWALGLSIPEAFLLLAHEVTE